MSLRSLAKATLEKLTGVRVFGSLPRGIDLVADNIHILYEDTEQRTVAQGIVGRKVGVDFINKRIAINVAYVQHILGIPFHQDITQTKIKQVEAPRKQVSPEMQQLLESAPQ